MVTYDLFHWWLSSVTVWYLSLNIIIITSSSWLWLVWHYFFRSSIHLLPYSELYTLTFLGLPRGLRPVIQELPPPTKGKRSGGITIRCPNHLNWLLLTQRSSTSCSFQMSELPYEMWVKPSVQSKLILTAHILPCPNPRKSFSTASPNSSLTWEPASTTSLWEEPAKLQLIWPSSASLLLQTSKSKGGNMVHTSKKVRKNDFMCWAADALVWHNRRRLSAPAQNNHGIPV